MYSRAFVSRPEPVRRTVEPDPVELVERLTRAAQAWSPGTRVTAVRRLAQGASSLTYAADTTNPTMPRIVVKVAPQGLPATRHRDVLRQARLLASLSSRPDIPTPDVLFTDTGLFAMSYRVGDAYEPTMDEPVPLAAGELRGRALAASEILARLHSQASLPSWIDEEPEVSLVDEVHRWDRALATLPAEFGLDWQPRSARLRSTMPPPWPSRLTHGDYRLGNLLCAGERVTAVLDWEIWARSDPRLDVAWYLLNLEGLHPGTARTVESIPTREEILAAYAGPGGAPPDESDWFLAVGLYKFVATIGLIAKFALKRGEVDGWGARMVARLPDALERIDEFVGHR
jgi:aminoglycoside phosphotransferase (APT) family kinase protein